jgi:hypothetical protein
MGRPANIEREGFGRLAVLATLESEQRGDEGGRLLGETQRARPALSDI